MFSIPGNLFPGGELRIVMARFDVLMPTANPDAGLVLRAVRSVVGQSFPDWQLLIGGDGQDSRIAAAIAAIGDPRIVYAAFPARGKAATLNALIEQSQAAYIAYLDDDDFWYAGHLATASAAIDAQGARFLHTGGWCVSVARAEGRFRELGRHKLHMGPLSDLLLYSISHINVVHERAVLDAAGPYDAARRFYIDWDMFIRMAALCAPLHVPEMTCEHWLYYDAEGKLENPISRQHMTTPEATSAVKRANFLRALARLDDAGFLALVSDLETKTARLWRLEAELAAQAPKPPEARRIWDRLKRAI